MSEDIKEQTDEGEMSLSDHLRELRNRVLISLGVLALMLALGLYFAADIVNFLLRLGGGLYQYVYISPQELLLQYVSVAFVFAVVISIPVIVYEVWAFVRPGLKEGENRLFVAVVAAGLVFFMIGVFFAYSVMLPFMLEFFYSLSSGTDIEGYVSVGNFLSFVLTILVVFGAVFELPVVTVLLNRLGFVRVEWLKAARRVVIVLIFFVAAVITPPDIFSQIITALPMIALYELSIFLCSLTGRRDPMR